MEADLFDWPTAVELLHRISREHVVLFLEGRDREDVYGAGFFCDGYDGSVYLVANTEQFHQASLREYEAKFGQTDTEAFRWDIGNWKYPGGLFPSSSAEQQAFDTAWEEYRGLLSEIQNEDKQAMLEDACVEVLTRLVKEGVFSSALHLTGLTVLGPVGEQGGVLEYKKRFDMFFQPDREREQK